MSAATPTGAKRPVDWLDAFEADIQATIDRDEVCVNGRMARVQRAEGLRMALAHFKALRKEAAQ